MKLLRSSAAAVLFAFLSCTILSQAEEAKVPLFDDLGSYTRKVTTDSAEAQRYFDQGLRFLFGFNHGMAIRSFQAAAKADVEGHWA